MINSILEITTVIIIIIFCYQIGLFFLSVAKINNSKENIIFSIGLGLCATIIILTILGFIGILNAVIIKATVFLTFIILKQ